MKHIHVLTENLYAYYYFFWICSFYFVWDNYDSFSLPPSPLGVRQARNASACDFDRTKETSATLTSSSLHQEARKQQRWWTDTLPMLPSMHHSHIHAYTHIHITIHIYIHRYIYVHIYIYICLYISDLFIFSKVLKFPMKPLSLHTKQHELSAEQLARKRSRIRFTGVICD